MTKPTGRPRGRPRKHPRPDDTPTTATTLEAKAPEEGELEQLESEIADMERELTAESEPLVWGEVDAGELACREQRRGVLPRLITAAKIKRLVLQKRRTEAELEELRKECESAYAKLERAEAKRLRAEQEMLQAREAWSHPNILSEKRERRLRDYEREIAALKREA